MKRFILFVITIMSIALTGCQTIEREEMVEVNATVTDMQYERSYMTTIPVYIGKTATFVSQTHSARYLVTISYEDVSETFNSKGLYENVNEGDTIKMVLYRTYDEEGNLVKEELQLPE